MAFDYEAAKKSGASDDDIIQYLTKTRHFDVDGALAAGATKPEIIQHLSTTSAPSFAAKKEAPKQSFVDKAKGVMDYVVPAVTQGVGGVVGTYARKHPQETLDAAGSMVKNTGKAAVQLTVQNPAIAEAAGAIGGERARSAVMQPREVPGLGTVKPLSAAPQDIAKNNAQTAGETAAEAANAYLEVGAPGAGKVLSKIGKPAIATAKKLFMGSGEILTGIKAAKLNQWFNMAKEAPEELEQLKKIVIENPQNPHLGLAKRIADKVTQMKTSAQEAFTAAKDTWRAANPDMTFDLSHKVPELKKPLAEFNLGLKQVKNPTGQLTSDFAVTKSKVAPWTNQEMTEIQGLVDKLRGAKDLSVDDLTDLSKSFDSAYDAVKPGIDGKPKPYHALVMKLKGEAESFIHGVLPTELKNANKAYQDYYKVQDLIGNRIVDANGEVKAGAETFLANLGNLNKGAERKAVEEASARLGIHVVKDSEKLHTARQMMELVPTTTKNRFMDFLRSGLARNLAAAGAVANPAIGVPALLANVLSSPKAFSGLIEAVAGASRKLPMGEAMSKISPAEIQAIIAALHAAGAVTYKKAQDALSPTSSLTPAP